MVYVPRGSKSVLPLAENSRPYSLTAVISQSGSEAVTVTEYRSVRLSS